MAATANINPTPQSVTSLVSKLGDADPDFRFMSLNDLLHLLNIAKPDFLQHDYNTAARAVDSIIKTLDDQNGEVQNMAIKCVAPLVGKVPMAIIAPMIDKLSSMVLKNSVDNAVTSLALRSVIIALPRPVPGISTTPDVQQSYDAIRRVLIPRLIGPNAATPRRQTTDISLPTVPAGMLQGDDASPETVGVLIEVVRCFGPLLQSVEVEAMQHVVMQLLESNRHSSVVKKRAVVAISMLAVYLADEHLRDVIQRLAFRLSDPGTGDVSRRLYISIIGSMARSIPIRFGPHIASTVPLMLKALSEEELQDHLERLSDGEDIGIEFNEVREAALRIDEREENVRLEVISALALLIRKTGEGLHVANFSLDDLDPPIAAPAPLNRKRRRQSSAGTATTVSQFMAGSGLTSPVLERVPTTGPRADLAQLTPGIVKASIKQLKGKTVPTKQSIINLLDDIVLVQRGGLASFFPDLVGSVLDAAKSTGHGATASSLASAGGSASATLSTLRIATLRLISDISKTHSSSVLQPYLTSIVAGVINAVHDRFYKISSEAIRTAEELVKTITPPRSRNSGSKFKAELESLYEVLMDKGSANDADAEVRQRAIHALGALISRTFGDGSNLLSADKRMKALNILRERLKNETTRLAAVRAVDNVAAFASSPGELERGWIQDVALELSAQLRKANRSLRGSSVNALKHLILSKASQGQLEKQTVDGVVSALMPAVTNSDTHLLGPALVILASLTPSHADVTVSKDMVAALCQLLKSHFAGIALDQLLELVARIGESGASQTLMQGLLKDVSISGDPSVVGKVIGTLLVTGDTSAGVSVDSFISELENSSKTGDEARVSLALAVLGETGMRLGSSSPMRPDLFLRQFHSEPDKVSLAAAIALGRAGSGNASEFLPVILENMQAGGNTQYLLIQSIKEILLSIAVQSVDIREYAVPIWDQLRKASETADNRVVCAECVGRLVILDPSSFMTKLQVFLLIETEIFFVANSYQALLKDTSSGIRGMAVQAVRYALPESDEAFDNELKNYLIDMLLVMLQDTDTEIRRLAMSTLNSAAHNKPDLILPHLGELMPFVLGESIIKPELVKEVMLGPFKHTVDDGLEVRKSAYETLYALMETAFTRINNIDFYDRVVAGLKDDNDIRQLCNLMVSKLIVIDPDETARRLDSIAEAYRGVLSIKLKDNAVKQDVEKQEEANKSVLRVTLLLGDKMKAMTGNAGAVTSNAGAAGIWTSYWEWANKEFEKQLKGLREESKELQSRMV
ncbi:Cullin-associated NEDD8-dissociated protein 1, C-terminal part [Metarhizium anisopliae]|nr:Cullin-associated NEDD8-dissociated protein 1, C-terminal part [Metarhizium anisopliae]